MYRTGGDVFFRGLLKIFTPYPKITLGGMVSPKKNMISDLLGSRNVKMQSEIEKISFLLPKTKMQTSVGGAPPIKGFAKRKT